MINGLADACRQSLSSGDGSDCFVGHPTGKDRQALGTWC